MNPRSFVTDVRRRRPIRRVPRPERAEVPVVEVPVLLGDQRAERGVQRVRPAVFVGAKASSRAPEQPGDVDAAPGSKTPKRRDEIFVRRRGELGSRQELVSRTTV